VPGTWPTTDTLAAAKGCFGDLLVHPGIWPANDYSQWMLANFWHSIKKANGKKGAAQQERKKEVPRLNRGLQVSFGEERMENEQEKPNFFSDPFNFECGRFHCQYDP